MNKVNVNAIIDNSKFNKFFAMVFSICLLAVIFDGYDMNVYGTTLPSIMKELALNPTQTGFLASTALAGMIFGAILFGMLADRIGRKKVLMIGMAIYAVFTGLCGFVSDVNAFAVLRFIAGMGMASISPVATSLLSEFSPKAIRGILVTLLITSIQVGQLIATLSGVALIESVGWRAIYWIAFVPLLLVAIAYALLPESINIYLQQEKTDKICSILKKSNPEFNSSEDDVYEVSAVNKTKATLASLFQEGRAWNTVMIWIMFFCNLYIAFGVLTWLPKLMTMMGYTLKSSLIFSAIISLGGIVGSLAGGMIAQKIGFRKVLIAYYLACAVMINLVTLKMSFGLFIVVLAVTGLFIGSQQNMLYAYASDNYPGSILGTALGWGSSFGRLGSVIAPMLIGVLMTAGLSVTSLFTTFTVPALAAAIAVFLMKKPPAAYDDPIAGKVHPKL
ncbi:MFS transporter [Desulfitobacterium chlororespirans]|uniref:MFS transporter, AAHS family, benzoate transport protein n=1 Tax=Desulfitobacterium chlororespirans DSM 11544 TaxID=1121395 RepID=A0A1M7U9D8_9FIRM|nr:aromatic acid/H+ symport family MFS transporter [Desulfitobacterium chlororespirans]SHN79659.1 MFS transporter, AAHS family, benzoate transport protein [Desulfitobacterium chlororespirans DSM 11544]